MLLAACDATVKYHPVALPIEFSVNSNGEIAVSRSTQVVTPLGTFKFEASAKLTGSSDETVLAINHYLNNEAVQSRYRLQAQSEDLKACVSGQAEVRPDLGNHAIVVSALNNATRIVVTNQSASCPQQPAEYTLMAQHSGKCLDIPFSTPSDHTQIQQYTCHRAPNQRWLLQQNADGYYRIKSVATGGCLDIPNASHNVEIVQQFQCHDGTNQQWSIWPTGIVARHSGMCLDIRAGDLDDHGVLQQYPCHGGANQRWTVA